MNTFWLLRFSVYQLSLLLTYSAQNNWDVFSNTDAAGAVRFVAYIFLIGLITFCIVLVPAYLSIHRLTPVRFKKVDWISDAVVVLVTVLAITAWIFVIPSADYSFGDSHGLIVDRGQITPYGWAIKTRNWFACLSAAALYFVLVCVVSFWGNKGKNKP